MKQMVQKLQPGDSEPVAEASITLSCSNGKLEIQCDSTGCNAESSSSVTSMQLTLNNLGDYSACAYSGCWEGQAEVLQTDSHLILHSHEAPFVSGDSKTNEASLVISVDLADNIAVLKVDSFAQPLQCRQSSG